MKELLFGLCATLCAASAWSAAISADGVALEGPFVPGAPLRAFLHLGESYDTTDLARGAGGLHHDYLGAYGGEQNVRPYPGLTFSGLETSAGEGRPLTWTIVASDSDDWRTAGGDDARNDYNKYLCIYLQVPGTDSRLAQVYSVHDDGLWMWVNGRLVHQEDTNKQEFFDFTLDPGENCVLFKFEEISGGDSLQIRIQKAGNGPSLDDLTYSFYPKTTVFGNPVTGDEAWFTGSTLKCGPLPYFSEMTQYQITESDDPSSLASDGWAAYTPVLVPPDYAVKTALSEGVKVTPRIWLRKGTDDASPVCLTFNTLTYTEVAPTVVALDTGLDLDPVNGTTISPLAVSGGSYDTVSGIESMWVEPASLKEAGEVTLYVRNRAGLVSSAKAQVTVVKRDAVYVDDGGDDVGGAGTISSPYKTFARAAAIVSGSLKTIVIMDGTYGADAGWAFPVSIPDGVTVMAADGAEVVFDAGNAADHVVVFDGVANAKLSGVRLQNSNKAAVLVANGATGAVVEGCSFAQTYAVTDVPTAVTLDGASGLTLDGCDFVGLTGRRYVIKIDGKDSTLNVTDCLFKDNVLRSYGNLDADYVNRCGTVFSSDVNTMTFTGCEFRNNTAPDGVPHDSCHSAAIYCGGCNVLVDRCSFVANHGAGLFGFSGNDGFLLRSCLFADNDVTKAMQCGYNCKIHWRNCTFVRNGGGYASYGTNLSEFDNCIFYKDGPLSRGLSCSSWVDPTGRPDAINLVNSVRYLSQDGNGYNAGSSTGVVTDDPKLVNAEALSTAASFDPRPYPESYVIDASVGEVSGDYDLAGNIRIADNDGDGTATADLGCYESLFNATQVATFEVPVPGAVSALRGLTVTVPVSITKPVDGPVTANVVYGEGVTGLETLTFSSSTAELELTLRPNCPDVTYFTLTDAGSTGVVGCRVNVYAADLTFTVGGEVELVIPVGAVVELPVELSLAGATVPEDFSFSIGSLTGGGDSTAVWTGDETKIPSGAHSAAGKLRITGGKGLVNVPITIAGGTFVESSAATVTVRVFGYDGALYVRPGNGYDVFGSGTADNPFNTIAYALGVSRPGDEIRILPGVYGADKVTFPIRSEGRTVTGWRPTGTASPADVVLDGGDSHENIFYLDGSDATRIANLTLKNTTGGAISVSTLSLTVTNCLFSQQTERYDDAGAIDLRRAVVTAQDCVFTGMVRRAVIYCRNAIGASTFTSEDCTFVDNVSAFSALAGDCTATGTNEGGGEVSATFNLTGSTFVRNRAVLPEGRPMWLSDYFRSSVLTVRVNGQVSINGCRFLANEGFNMIGVSGDSQVTVVNSLFAGNTASESMVCGYHSWVDFRNCTMVRNSGGYGAMEIYTTFTDSIIVNDGMLHFGSNHMPADKGAGIWGGYVKLVNTVLYGTEVDPVHSYHAESSGVITDDPLLVNIGAEVTSKAFNPMPGLGSPALDKATSYDVGQWGELDVLGHPRVTKAPGGSEAVADLGALEYFVGRRGFYFFVR